MMARLLSFTFQVFNPAAKGWMKDLLYGAAPSDEFFVALLTKLTPKVSPLDSSRLCHLSYGKQTRREWHAPKGGGGFHSVLILVAMTRLPEWRRTMKITSAGSSPSSSAPR